MSTSTGPNIGGCTGCRLDLPHRRLPAAQKWLKDRRGRTLSWEDIGDYQKIVRILVETDRIMKEIELPLEGEPMPQ